LSSTLIDFNSVYEFPNNINCRSSCRQHCDFAVDIISMLVLKFQSLALGLVATTTTVSVVQEVEKVTQIPQG
jgi:hypothetical protein